MANDQFIKITRQGWGKNILNSFVGAVLGVLLFFGSFVVLWMNEGRTNWATVASGSLQVGADAVNPANEGQFVAITGEINSSERLGDAPYIETGAYLRLERKAEMFAWVEKKKSETNNEVGGGSTTKTTYEYVKEWTSNPQDSSSFEYSQNHTNPPQSIKDDQWTVAAASVGAYRLDTAALELPDATRVKLTADTVMEKPGQRLAGEYLFVGKGTPDDPRIGDTRIHYKAVPNNARVTVFGAQRGSALAPHLYRGETAFYRALLGEREAAINQLQTEYTTLTWALRVAGFLMMWIGMTLALSPITAFLNVLPFLGNAGGCAIGGITFGIALAVSTVTIVIAIIAHSLIAMIAVLALLIGGVALWGKLSRRDMGAAA